jgi:hypothetical protein
MASAIASIGVEEAVLTTNGTPAAAAARAAVRSPSARARESTPTGARKKGAGDRVPSTSTVQSRSSLPVRCFGHRRQRSKASRLARIVHSAPAPPAM